MKIIILEILKYKSDKNSNNVNVLVMNIKLKWLSNFFSQVEIFLVFRNYFLLRYNVKVLHVSFRLILFGISNSDLKQTALETSFFFLDPLNNDVANIRVEIGLPRPRTHLFKSFTFAITSFFHVNSHRKKS